MCAGLTRESQARGRRETRSSYLRICTPLDPTHWLPAWRRWGGVVWLNREKPRGARVFSPRRPHAWVDPCTEELCGYACPSRPWRESVRSASLSQFFVLEAVWAEGWPAVPAQAQPQPGAAALAAAGCPDRAFVGSAHRAPAPWPGIISQAGGPQAKEGSRRSCRLLGGWRLRPAKVTQQES